MLRFRRHAGFGPIEKGENMSDWCERRRFLTASMVVGLGMVLVGTWSVTSRFCFSEQIGAGPQSAEAAQAKTAKRIFIVTDLEGASGVYQSAQTREAGPLNDMAKEYLMGDIAAVVRGLRLGERRRLLCLTVAARAVVPHLMEPGAKYILGRPLPGSWRARQLVCRPGLRRPACDERRA